MQATSPTAPTTTPHPEPETSAMTEAEILAKIDLTPSEADLAIDLRHLAATSVLGCEVLKLAGQAVPAETLAVLGALRRAVQMEERLAGINLLVVGVLGREGTVEEALGVAGERLADFPRR